MAATPGVFHGAIILIVGGMFAGKSEELVRQARRMQIAKKRVIAFRPASDTRQSHVKSRAGGELLAVCAERAADMVGLSEGYDVVAVDEAQFFDEGLRDAVFVLARRGQHVIVAALNATFDAKPFPSVSPLYAIASEIRSVHAVCMRCGDQASFSQRLVPSKEQVVIGDTEAYEARCLRCYEPPAS